MTDKHEQGERDIAAEYRAQRQRDMQQAAAEIEATLKKYRARLGTWREEIDGRLGDIQIRPLPLD